VIVLPFKVLYPALSREAIWFLCVYIIICRISVEMEVEERPWGNPMSSFIEHIGVEYGLRNYIGSVT
jgi:hypothetical protein